MYFFLRFVKRTKPFLWNWNERSSVPNAAWRHPNRGTGFLQSSCENTPILEQYVAATIARRCLVLLDCCSCHKLIHFTRCDFQVTCKKRWMLCDKETDRTVQVQLWWRHRENWRATTPFECFRAWHHHHGSWEPTPVRSIEKGRSSRKEMAGHSAQVHRMFIITEAAKRAAPWGRNSSPKRRSFTPLPPIRLSDPPVATMRETRSERNPTRCMLSVQAKQSFFFSRFLALD